VGAAVQRCGPHLVNNTFRRKLTSNHNETVKVLINS